MYTALWLGLQTVASLERCPLFRVFFIGRFCCIGQHIVIHPSVRPCCHSVYLVVKVHLIFIEPVRIALDKYTRQQSKSCTENRPSPNTRRLPSALGNVSLGFCCQQLSWQLFIVVIASKPSLSAVMLSCLVTASSTVGQRRSRVVLGSGDSDAVEP